MGNVDQNRFIVADATGYLEEIAREDILTDNEHKFDAIQVGRLKYFEYDFRQYQYFKQVGKLQHNGMTVDRQLCTIEVQFESSDHRYYITM